MTLQDYITSYAPKFATEPQNYKAYSMPNKVMELCGCTQDRAIKTLIATFDEALKIRDNEH